MASDSKLDFYFIGVDVGTGSIRAGLFRGSNGELISATSHAITVFHHDDPSIRHYEQSSTEIWNNCCLCVKHIVKESEVNPSQIKGISFDATCSLVAIDADGKPVSLSLTQDDNRNIILWMDHRAIHEAEEINKLSSEHSNVLKYVGNKVSPEMEIPKLLWTKKHLPDSWKRTQHFFDLADFMAYKATGLDCRSLCTVACKWNFLAHTFSLEGKSGWDDEYFKAIGLEDLVESHYAKIGGKDVGISSKIREIATPIEGGLSEHAAKELGLLEGTHVGIGVIDAHAGGIGVLGTNFSQSCKAISESDLRNRIALIAGTSSCHMYAADAAPFMEGVWGPYYSAMIPGMWLMEAGQNAAGSVIEHVIKSHPAHEALVKLGATKISTAFEILNERVAALSKKTFPAKLTQHVHVLADFHGNRAPLADPHIQGSIVGLTLDDSIDNLAVLYLATIQSLAYGTRRIISYISENTERNSGKPAKIDTIFLTGGLAKNPLFVSQHAEITNCRIVLPKTDAVLLGSAIVAAVASGFHKNMFEAMACMSSYAAIVEPSKDIQVVRYHEKKYNVFLQMYDHQLLYRNCMNEE